MNFETFRKKLGIIQSDYIDIDRTLIIKFHIVGSKRMEDCTEKELEKIMRAYREEYKLSNKR
jgi:uncharacterized metal-binding protein